MERPLKILAIQFKYFGDTVLMIPALRAIRERWPDCALHVLVPEEVAPVLQHSSLLTRVWTVPRSRGRARLRSIWPVIRQLRRDRFDRSVDFGGNDRGALLSLFCGARERLGPVHPGGFVGRRFCYTRRVAPAPTDRHEALRLLHILSAWGITPPQALEIQIHTDPASRGFAEKILPEGKVICHLSAGQSKKEWPVRHWAAFGAPWAMTAANLSRISALACASASATCSYSEVSCPMNELRRRGTARPRLGDPTKLG